ncbi:hypothetical protein CPB84DRAFT_1843702 [Gymnopilus junonius]|uniref:Uncharacterized protein n=1 Tax=Gymnopilus junonius TaxID=109634 RepID=A0A9P5NSR3_GYMJU|nr:hypothetical protein CPB84DRAFT_1843702 [Gymnopilus junonius]
MASIESVNLSSSTASYGPPLSIEENVIPLTPHAESIATSKFPPPSSPVELQILWSTLPKFFAQIHYFPALELYDRRLLFPSGSLLPSALDLATDPDSFNLASLHNEHLVPFSQLKLYFKSLEAFLSYPPRGQFPQDYSRDPANRIIRYLPLVSEALTSYEKRSMLPVALWEMCTTPNLFVRTPKVMHAYRGRFTFASDSLEDRSKFHQRIDGLDLWDRATVKVTFHPNCQKSCIPFQCKQGKSLLMEWGTCSRILTWEGQLYRRRKVIPLSQISLWRRSTFRYYLKVHRFLGERLVLWVTVIVFVFIAFPLAVTWAAFTLSLSAAWSLNSISGGAILGAIFGRFKLNGIMTPLDKRVCPPVTHGSFPCVIPSNPDVAGIGGRLALYIQTICLITLLALKPNGAATSRLTLAVTSLAFGFSALISAISNQLSLYHIILAAKFQTLPLLTASIVEFQAPPDRPWYMYYINPPCFGVIPSCNIYVRSQSYFTIGHATVAAPRITSLINVLSTGILLASDVKLTFDKYKEKSRYPQTLHRDIRRLRHVRNLEELYVANWLFDNTSPLAPMPDICFRGKILEKEKGKRENAASLPRPATSASPRSHSRTKRAFFQIRRWIYILYRAFIFALPYPKFLRYLVALIVTVILICNVENTIKLNTVAPGDNAWTYGQVLAIFLTVVPVMQVWILLGFWLPKGLVHQKRRKKVD